MHTENKTEFVRARIEPHLKASVHAVLAQLGITPSQAITMFYKSIEREHGLPLSLMVPNAETARAIREAKSGRGLKKFKSLEDLFKDLKI